MHILLRPVPGLSVTLERRPATFLFAATKCTNINSAILRQAPPAITGNNMAPRGKRENRLPRNLGRGQAVYVRARSQSAGGGKKPYRQKGAGRVQASLRAPRYAGGTGSRRPHVSSGSTRRDRDRTQTTRLPVAAVAAPPCPRRSRRPPCANPSQRPRSPSAGTNAGSVRPQRGQLPSGTPSHRVLMVLSGVALTAAPAGVRQDRQCICLGNAPGPRLSQQP
jgi:hypothetical protein